MLELYIYIYTLWQFNSLLLKTAIEIGDLPIENGGSFHSYVSLPEGIDWYISWLLYRKYQSNIHVGVKSRKDPVLRKIQPQNTLKAAFVARC